MKSIKKIQYVFHIEPVFSNSSSCKSTFFPITADKKEDLLSKDTIREESDEESSTSTNPKIAKAIPKLNKSADDTQQSSDIDFIRKSKGSTAKDAVKLSGDSGPEVTMPFD